MKHKPKFFGMKMTAEDRENLERVKQSIWSILDRNSKTFKITDADAVRWLLDEFGDRFGENAVIPKRQRKK